MILAADDAWNAKAVLHHRGMNRAWVFGSFFVLWLTGAGFWDLRVALRITGISSSRTVQVLKQTENGTEYRAGEYWRIPK